MSCFFVYWLKTQFSDNVECIYMASLDTRIILASIAALFQRVENIVAMTFFLGQQ